MSPAAGAALDPEAYDAWYRTARGRWIADTEYRLLMAMLRPQPGARILDLGCGTGHFTRRLALDGFRVCGIDADPSMVRYAAEHRAADEHYAVADARSLPFPGRSFDECVAVTSLCFIRPERAALREISRVTCRGAALGLLNRRSLLYHRKGQGGGVGAYRGAHWHTAEEVISLLSDFPAPVLAIRSAIFLPSGGSVARVLERLLPNRLLVGGFLAVTGHL